MSSLCLFFFVMMNLKLIREEDFFYETFKIHQAAGALGAALAMTATPVMAATDPAAIEPVPGPMATL